jgi:hypothetical protein
VKRQHNKGGAESQQIEFGYAAAAHSGFLRLRGAPAPRKHAREG